MKAATVSQLQAPAAAMSDFNPRRTSRCWATQKLTRVAKDSQFAVHRDSEDSFWPVYGVTPLDLPEAHERGDSFAVRSPFRDGEASI